MPYIFVFFVIPSVKNHLSVDEWQNCKQCKAMTLLRPEKKLLVDYSFRANLPYLFHSLNMIPWVPIFYQLWFRVCRYFRPASKRTETFVPHKYICLNICQIPSLALFSPPNQNSNWKYGVHNALKYICLNTP